MIDCVCVVVVVGGDFVVLEVERVEVIYCVVVVVG